MIEKKYKNDKYDDNENQGPQPLHDLLELHGGDAGPAVSSLHPLPAGQVAQHTYYCGSSLSHLKHALTIIHFE